MCMTAWWLWRAYVQMQLWLCTDETVAVAVPMPTYANPCLYPYNHPESSWYIVQEMPQILTQAQLFFDNDPLYGSHLWHCDGT